VTLVHDPSPLEVEIVIAKLKYKLAGGNYISAEPIQAGGETFWSETINSLIIFEVGKNHFINGRCLLLYQFTRGVMKHCSNYPDILVSLLLALYKMLSSILCCIDEITGIISMSFDVTDQLVISVFY
jgi:hypothetical protein